ncbi:HRDC domain-containing protein [Paenibacillus lutrae]|uniref:HRDC domain protein n=1 Tax=Paenibacillus lutrae TaxID=2078573 RepID=A0A7X3FGD9_9BACL|nr:HRDC domain-containing protein [Paenibacillus lutrae]MVO98983.1 HRDC domain protein [Paenibacillus lutrae]
MNVIYLTTLEKPLGEGRVRQAQFFAGEKVGIWQALWNEIQADGKQVQDIWYEGEVWSELLEAIRLGLQNKLAEGYKPLLKGIGEEAAVLSAKAESTQMLHFYGECNADEGIYEQLRSWRREQSFKEGRSPFILASNRMLQMIAAFCPKSVEELLHIPGFGQNRATKYGGDVLRITKDVQRSTDFPLDWVAERTDRPAFDVWLNRQKERRVQKEAARQSGKRKLLEAMAEGSGLGKLRAELAFSSRELVDLLEELEREGYDVLASVEKELMNVPADQLAEAEKLFADLGDRYLKPVLQGLYGENLPDAPTADQVYEWLRLLRFKVRKEQANVRQEQAG